MHLEVMVGVVLAYHCDVEQLQHVVMEVVLACASKESRHNGSWRTFENGSSHICKINCWRCWLCNKRLPSAPFGNAFERICLFGETLLSWLWQRMLCCQWCWRFSPVEGGDFWETTGCELGAFGSSHEDLDEHLEELEVEFLC